MKIRSDYKTSRNLVIYEEYISSDVSYNKLAKKHNLSPQRVRSIINGIKEKGLEKGLDSIKSSKTDREQYKNLAVEQREKGNLEIALKMFEDIVEWDEKHKNYRGQDDVYGHIRLVYKAFAYRSKTKKEKLHYLKLFDEFLDNSMKLGKEGKLPGGALVMHKVHKATSNLALSLIDKKNKEQLLKDALQEINAAIVALPGSHAGKAWPLKIKAKILINLERYDQAYDAIAAGFKYLYDYYDEHMHWDKYRLNKGENLIGNDQAAMKIQSWQLGLNFVLGDLYIHTKKPVLAKGCLEAVAETYNPDGYFTTHINDAKEILKLI